MAEKLISSAFFGIGVKIALRDIWVDFYHKNCPNAGSSPISGTHIERVNIASGDSVPGKMNCPKCSKTSAMMVQLNTVKPL